MYDETMTEQPINPETNKPYQPGDIVEGRYKVLRNGAGYDLEVKRIGLAPGTYFADPQPLTSDKASELVNIRENKRRQAVHDALANAHPDFRTDYDGLRLIFDNQIILASDPDAGRASTEATKLILRGGDYMQDARRGAPQQINIQVNIVPDAMDDEEW